MTQIEVTLLDTRPVEALAKIDGLPAEFVAEAEIYGGVQEAHTVTAIADGALQGLLLVVNRPHAAYVKVVGAWLGEPVLAELVAALEEYAFTRTAVAVKWQLPQESPLVAQVKALGYESLREPINPVRPVVDELADDITDYGAVPVGLVKWRVALADPVEPPYYRQTTGFTCGPVSLMVTFDLLGAGEGLDRTRELGLWREGTASGGTMPYGLAVAAARRGYVPTLYLTDEDPERTDTSRSKEDRELRRFVSGQFADEAAELGVETVVQDISADFIRELAESGKILIPLIDSYYQRGRHGPHWIVVHGFHDGAFLVQDSSTAVEVGETWVDLHNHPVPVETLDELAWWGSPRYRAILAFDR
ncbi:peptidase C39 family protein [Rhodococcoides fascians]|uniref:peptidase C39 family protein n=1 Tax=Rhodococcoides fascians TaxID=1828 RepID=UPI0006915369|nr:peptidase C39 family protein [Rhodococcus fascians]